MQLRWFKSHDFTPNELTIYNISICPICLKYAPIEKGDPILMALNYKHPFKIAFHHDCACLTNPSKIHERFIGLNYLKVYTPTVFTPFKNLTESKERLRVYITLEILHPLFYKKLFKNIFSEDFYLDQESGSWKKLIDVKDRFGGIFDMNIPFIPSNYYILNFEVDVPVYRKVFRKLVMIDMEHKQDFEPMGNYGIKLLKIDIDDSGSASFDLEMKEGSLNRKNTEDSLYLDYFCCQSKKLTGFFIDKVRIEFPFIVLEDAKIPNKQENTRSREESRKIPSTKLSKGSSKRKEKTSTNIGRPEMMVRT